MQERVKLIIVLDEGFDIIAASTVAHVQLKGAWPTIALLAGGMALRNVELSDVVHEPGLRERLGFEVLVKEDTEPKAREAGVLSFYDLIAEPDESPYLIYLEQKDAYVFDIFANDLVPIQPIRVFGEQMCLQANVDIHLSRVGQLRAAAMAEARRQKIAIPGQGGLPSMGTVPGDGKLILP